MHATTNVWAREEGHGRNRVRQLLVRESDQIRSTESTGGDQRVISPFGSWPARRGAGTTGQDPLTAVLPVLDSGHGRLEWRGSRAMTSTEEVLDSYVDAINLVPRGGVLGLRRPQSAALHSIIGYQLSGLPDPGIVVMPTGTGKTDTMLAWLVARRPTKVLVIVPTATLRDQLARKFETLGVLQEQGVVDRKALRPRVGRIEHRVADLEEAQALVAASNVVIATPSVLQATEEAVRHAIYAACSNLIVDEAHHAPAATWTSIINAFQGRPVLLFTATPFRRDGRSLPGRVISRFPLKEAQAEGYFSHIEFSAILDFDDDDHALALAALARLRADVAEGLQHVLLARVESKVRATEIVKLYRRLAPDLVPQILHDGLSNTQRAAALDAVKQQQSRVIVCVDMLGEGFDLPTLKVGALHDVRRSLSPMIQLIGRLARTASSVPIGDASVFVRHDPRGTFSPLRTLLREDPDWDRVLSDVTDRATEQVEGRSTFEASFHDAPTDVPVRLLQPKMSAVAYATTADDWNPQSALDVYAGAVLDGLVSTNVDENVAWLVLQTTEALRWGDIPSLQPTAFTLIVLHLDRARGLLYVHGSDTRRSYDDLAKAVLGGDAAPLKGYTTFRVFSGLDRVVPNNIGLLDARDRDKRFSMHVGSDVETALTEAERSHKANTHLSARAFSRGDSVTIAASLSGRFWSMRGAEDLADWCAWCREQGGKLRNGSIDVHTLFRSMIIPVDVKERPPHPLLAVEWPWNLYMGSGTTSRLVHGDPEGSGPLIPDAGLRVDDYASEGPMRFTVITPTAEVAYEATVGSTGVHYRASSVDLLVKNTRGAITLLSEWLNKNKPTLLFSGDRMISGDDRLLAPREDVSPYPRERLRSLNWVDRGVDIKVESQGPSRKPQSVQAAMARYLKETQAFDVLIDDDRSGEAADLVGVRIDRDDLVITLVHCKFSSASSPGARVADLYELCGQAMRGARWRDGGATPLLDHLHRRVSAYAQRTGGTAFEVGDRTKLFRLRQRAPLLFTRVNTVLVQPGMSVASATDEQLRLIAGAATYVQAVTKGGFEVYGSP